MVVLTATLASIGTAGVPGVGLIMLAMVLNQVNLPVEGIGLIIGVDRLLDMVRTGVNILGDATVTCVVARSEGALDLERFRDFLPDGRDHQALRTLMEFVLREPLAYDLELELLESEVTPMRLGEGSSCQLGWTTFVQPEANATARRRRVRIQMTR